MIKIIKNKELYPFLKIGYASFPLRDVNKKFEVVNTFDIDIKKPLFIDSKKENKYMHLHIWSGPVSRISRFFESTGSDETCCSENISED